MAVEENWRVESLTAEDPFAVVGGFAVFELWKGDVPAIWANSFLRAAGRGLAENSRSTYATRILTVAKWLDRRGLDFWTLRDNAGHYCREFREELVSLEEMNRSDKQNGRSKGKRRGLAWKTCQMTLEALGEVIDFWRQEDERSVKSKRHQKSRGAMSHITTASHRLPRFLKMPKRTHQYRRDEASLLNEVEQLWEFWMSQEPKKPKILRDRPKRDESEAQRKRRTRVEEKYRLDYAWWARNVAILALLWGGAFRGDELGKLRLDDVREDDDGRVWVKLVDRPDMPGTVKNSEKFVWVGWDPRAAEALQKWLSQRRYLVEKWSVRMAGEDHKSLLTLKSGAPFGSFHSSGAQWVKVSRGYERTFRHELETDGESWSFSAHMLRHACAQFMRRNGVPEHMIQMHLGHLAPESTAGYGREDREAFVMQFDPMEALDA